MLKAFFVPKVFACVPWLLPYSVRMRKNTDQKNFEYGHFWRSVCVYVCVCVCVCVCVFRLTVKASPGWTKQT